MISKTILIGSVEAEPQISTLPSGDHVVNFTLLTTESWKDSKSGMQKSRYEHHKIAIFVERLVEVVRERIHKGTTVYLEGQIESRVWVDASGTNRKAIDIVLRPGRHNLQVIDSDNIKTQNIPTPTI